MRKTVFLLCLILCILAPGCQNNVAPPSQPAATPAVTSAISDSPSAALAESNDKPANQQEDVQGPAAPSATDMPVSVKKTLGLNPHTNDTDGDGVSDIDDDDPAFTENLIQERSTAPLPINIVDCRVEDNATADHLEITMRNTGKEALTNFDIYFTITDKLDKSMEGYYVKLDGLTIQPNEKKTVHFDNEVDKPGHYYGNVYGLYGTSPNGLTFEIQLHASGYKPMDFSVDKAEGLAEVED